MKRSIFQIVLLFVFGIAAVVAVLIFSGVLPGFRAPSKGAGGDIVMWGTVPDAGGMNTFMAKFNDENKSLFKLIYVAKNPATFQEELVEALASGRGPDIFFMTDDMIIKHRDKVTILPYQTYPLRTFKDTFVGAGEIFLADSGVIGVPFAVNPLVMYYNRDIFADAGVAVMPKTWSEFVAVLANITKLDKNNNIVQSGLAFGDFLNNKNARDIMLMLLNQSGNPVISLTNLGYKSTLSDTFGFAPSPGEAAFAFFTQFTDQAKTTYSWNKSLPEAEDSFVSGKLATYFGFASELDDIKIKNPHLNFDAAMVPQKDEFSRITYGRVIGLAIAKNTKKPSYAAQAIFLLTDTKNDQALANILGWVPVRRDLLAAKQADPFAEVFYKSAIISRGFTDPNRAATTKIFRSVAEMYQTGLGGSDALLKGASGELQLLIK